MSKKILNIEGLKNELEGASLYFTKPSTPPSPVPNLDELHNSNAPTEANLEPMVQEKISIDRKPTEDIKKDEFTADGTNERPDERTNERTSNPKKYLPKRRTKVRHAFDIFADQLLSLREIALSQEIVYGERVLLGDLAQQALDMLIAKEKNK